MAYFLTNNRILSMALILSILLLYTRYCYGYLRGDLGSHSYPQFMHNGHARGKHGHTQMNYFPGHSVLVQHVNLPQILPSAVSKLFVSGSMNLISLPSDHIFQPTIFPSVAPITAPSFAPTLAATFAPSFEPTIATGYPTMPPVDFPTPLPTASPIMLPTVSPATTYPTTSPTTFVTSIPSVSPSLFPTSLLHEQFQPIEDFLNYQRSNFTTAFASANASTSSLAFIQVQKGALVTNRFGTWADFSSNAASLNIINQPIGLMAALVNCSTSPCHPSVNFFSSTCLDLNSVLLIWKSIVFLQPATVVCDGVRWRTGLFPNLNDSNVMYIFVDDRPIMGLEDVGEIIVGSVLAFEYKPGVAIYPLWTQNCSASVDSITIRYELNQPGQLTCGAFNSVQHILSVKAISKTSLSSANVLVTPSMNLYGQLRITGLNSQQQYFVYCYSRALSNLPGLRYRSSVEDAISRVSSISTRCCGSAQFLLSASADVLKSGPGLVPITVTLRNYSTNGFVSFIPQVSFVDSAQCNFLDMSSFLAIAPNLPWKPLSSTEIISVAGLDFFTEHYNNQRMFYVRFAASGCYAVSIRGVDSSPNLNFTVVAAAGQQRYSTLYLRAMYMPSAVMLSVKSCELVGVGLNIRVVFNFDTDLGATIGLPAKLQKQFSCSALLYFPGSSICDCLFSSANTLEVSISNCPGSDCDGYFPLPGSVVTVFGGAIRPMCSESSVEYCSELPYFLVTNVTVSSNEIRVTPTVVINAPTEIFLGDDFLELDTTMSTGNSGRSWLRYQWSVVLDFDNSSLASMLEMSLNSMDWSVNRIGLIPSSLLSQKGHYVFLLYLTNCFGVRSSGFKSVMVLDRAPAPVVTVLGMRTFSVFANERLSLETVTTHLPDAAVSYSWLVYRDDVLYSVPDSSVNDPRRFVVASNVLLPGFEYSFYVYLSCVSDLASSYDVVSVYVIPVPVQVIVAANYMTVNANHELLLDASAASSSDGRCVQNLEFAWTCLQLLPAGINECPNFLSVARQHGYEVVAGSVLAATVRIANLTNVLSAGNSFAFTAVVTCAVAGVSDSKVVSVDVLSATDDSPPVLTIQKLPSALVDNCNRIVQVGSVVNCSKSCVAEWSILSSNITISGVSLNSGIFYVPFVVQPNMMPSGLTFTVQLTVAYLHGSYSSTRISLVTNSPPAGGIVSCLPATGNEWTVFSITASNWQDFDLPLSYSFFQAEDSVGSVELKIIRSRSVVSIVESMLSPPRINRTSEFVGAVVWDVFLCQTRYSTAVSVEISSSRSYVGIPVNMTLALLHQNGDVILSNTNSIFSFVGPSGLNCSDPNLNDVNRMVACSNLLGYGVDGLTNVLRLLDTTHYLSLFVANSLAVLTSSSRLMPRETLLRCTALLEMVLSWSKISASTFSVASNIIFLDAFLISGKRLIDEYLDPTDIYPFLGLQPLVAADFFTKYAFLGSSDTPSLVAYVENNLIAAINQVALSLPIGTCATSSPANLQAVFCKQSVGVFESSDGVVRTDFVSFGGSKNRSVDDGALLHFLDSGLLAGAVTIQYAEYTQAGANITGALNPATNVRAIVTLSTTQEKTYLNSNRDLVRVKLDRADVSSALEVANSTYHPFVATIPCEGAGVMSSVSYTCSAEQTRGQPYTFNHTACRMLNNQSGVNAVIFTCPLYEENFHCYDVTTGLTCSLVLPASPEVESSPFCECPVSLQSTAVQGQFPISRALNPSFAYRFSIGLTIASTKVMVSGPKSGVLEIPSISTPTKKALSLMMMIFTTVVIIGFLFAFGCIAWHRLSRSNINLPECDEDDISVELSEYRGLPFAHIPDVSDCNIDCTKDSDSTPCGLSLQWISSHEIDDISKRTVQNATEFPAAEFCVSHAPCICEVTDHDGVLPMGRLAPTPTTIIGVIKPKRYFGTRGVKLESEQSSLIL